MLGGIAASRFEAAAPLSPRDFQLFHRACRVTDDAVHNVAVADAPYALPFAVTGAPFKRP